MVNLLDLQPKSCWFDPLLLQPFGWAWLISLFSVSMISLNPRYSRQAQIQLQILSLLYFRISRDSSLHQSDHSLIGWPWFKTLCYTLDNCRWLFGFYSFRVSFFCSMFFYSSILPVLNHLFYMFLPIKVGLRVISPIHFLLQQILVVVSFLNVWLICGIFT